MITVRGYSTGLSLASVTIKVYGESPIFTDWRSTLGPSLELSWSRATQAGCVQWLSNPLLSAKWPSSRGSHFWLITPGATRHTIGLSTLIGRTKTPFYDHIVSFNPFLLTRERERKWEMFLSALRGAVWLCSPEKGWRHVTFLRPVFSLGEVNTRASRLSLHLHCWLVTAVQLGQPSNDCPSATGYHVPSCGWIQIAYNPNSSALLPCLPLGWRNLPLLSIMSIVIHLLSLLSVKPDRSIVLH